MQVVTMGPLFSSGTSGYQVVVTMVLSSLVVTKWLPWVLSSLFRVSLSILSAQETQNIRWADKDPRVFFRGRDSNKARLELVKRHRSNTELFDVGIVAWFFFKHEEDVYGPKANRVGFNEFFKVLDS